MPVASYTIPNLIQGVSQQAPEQRRPTQVEAEFNCLNSPKDGLVGRGGADLLKEVTPGGDFAEAAFHEIFRGGEHYLAVIPRFTGNGTIKVYDLADGTECTVTGGAGQAYLACPSMAARQAFRFQTVDDYTFVANRHKIVAFTGAVQSTRPPEALVFIKAGGYAQKYTVSIVYGGNRYTWSYLTPDNSAVGNAQYISTAQIAATLYRALTGTAAVIPTSGAADDGSGVGPMFVGDVGGVGGSAVTGAITATSLGFTVYLRGNVIYIFRGSDSNAFTIDCGDSTGNTFMIALKDRARNLADLPERAFGGFRLQIAGAESTSEAADDYYVEYTGQEVWSECVGAGVSTTLDNTTMPHALINTGYRTFTFGPVTWGTRVAGDNTTAPKPYFVGEAIQAMTFYQMRLGLITEGAVDFSKSRNSFSFFRDTVQTVLSTDPASIPVSGSRAISLLRRAALVDESLFLWAQENQVRISTTDAGFRQDGIEVKPSTAYEFAEDCAPFAIGNGLFFTTDDFTNTTVRNLVYSAGGRNSVPIDVTSHAPEYIPTGSFHLDASEALGMVFVLTAGHPSGLFHYSYVVQGNEVVQSAWNRWDFPLLCNPQWVSEYKATLYVAAYQGTKLLLGKMPLRTKVVDPGGIYLTRLDWRVAESQVAMSYDGGLDRTTITLPLTALPAAQGSMVVAIRTTAVPYTRGSEIPIVSVGANTVVVSGNLTGHQFYVGVRISSSVTLSRFYPRDATGAVAQFSEDLKVARLYVSHTGAYSYRVFVLPDVGASYSVSYISPGGAPADGILDVPIAARADAYTATLINDSIFGGAWQRIKVGYETVSRFDGDARAANRQNSGASEQITSLRSEVATLTSRLSVVASKVASLDAFRAKLTSGGRR